MLAAGPLPAGTELVNSLGIRMVRIEPGEFLMGCGEAPPRTLEEFQARDWDEAPAHKVRITRPFWISAHEITNRQFEQFDPEHREFRGRDGVSSGDDEPVVFVTWQQAVAFCARLSEKEGRPYRLPTEAEWEYACRAGTATPYHTGDGISIQQANMGLAPDGSGRKIKAVAVGRYPPNPWGLHDMHGNVAEWCLDWYGPYAPGRQTDPVGLADGVARVARGGSYNIPSWRNDSRRYCRSSNRQGCLPDDANRVVGFRVVLGETPAGEPLPVGVPLHQQDVKQRPDTTRRPDPGRPHFVDFTQERKNPTIPEGSWGPLFGAWNHDTALCACPNGDMLAVWYTTKSESGRELALAASRLPAGSDRWQPASLFFDVPDVNDHAPALLCDGRRVYHFSNQALRGWVDAAVIMRVSDDNGATWSKPRTIVPRGRNPENPHSHNMPVCALQTQDGALCLVLDADRKKSCLAVSKDGGKSWRLTPGLIEGIHAATTQLADGTIVAFGRGLDPMPVSVSNDLGKTWHVRQAPFGGISVGQRAAALRLASGRLLLCGPDTRKPPWTGRRGTFAALSEDGGKTWAHVRHVPGVGGYLSAAQAPNGAVYLFGTRMSCVAFNEAWVEQGKPLATEGAEP